MQKNYLTKLKTHFYLKTLKKIRLEMNFLNLKRGTYKTPITNIMFNDERLTTLT